ncbi:MAG: trigger factor [Deltaproteobacteria bacterium]|nr:trigger factor [Deltaproteobacteria bacterium]
MKVQVEDVSAGKKRLSIEVGADEVSNVIKEAYGTFAKEAELEGFRKGKVPENILRQKFGKEIMGEAGSKLIDRTYPGAIKEKGLKPLCPPTIAVERLEEGSPFLYSAIVDVRPEIEVLGWRDIKIEKRPVDVTEEEVARDLEALRERHREFKETQTPARDGDMVTVDIDCMLDGNVLKGKGIKKHTFIVGEGTRFPELEESVRGVAAGGKCEFKKSFPSGYHDKDLAGKEPAFIVSVTTVKEKLLPPLDSEFAKDLSCENIDDLKGKLKEEIKRVKEKADMDRIRKEVMERLLNENPFEVPDALVDRYYVQIMSNIVDGVRMGVVNPRDWNISSPEAKAKYKEMAARQARGDIILDIIADREGIGVNEEEVNKTVADMGRAKGESGDAVMAKLKRDGTLSMLKEGIRREKTAEMIIEGGRLTAP